MTRDEFRKKWCEEKIHLGNGVWILFDGSNFILMSSILVKMKDDSDDLVGISIAGDVIMKLLNYQYDVLQDFQTLSK